ncbi:MAG TPA: histidine kinase [Treponema sp.]|nr:histidine kinase [Treponema sp.]HPC71004.1 histidine kinase [Treponema sp.]HRS03441.1 histidine kinase [Treponema sp.]HRU27957.1 histidine kinase [Treponema sp.]
MKKNIRNSFWMQMVLSIFGVFGLLVISTAYILYSTIQLQKYADQSFQKERYLKSIQEALITYQEPLLEYLSTRSSNALAKHLVESQNLRKRLPEKPQVSTELNEIREEQVYSLIRFFLDMADNAVEQKRGRNIEGYINLYAEMSSLLSYINSEIEHISTERFKNQIDKYGSFIRYSQNIILSNLLFIVSISIFSVLLLMQSVQKMTEPMVHLSAMATEISSGNFMVDDISFSSIYEIDHVIEAFNKMKREIRQYIEEIRLQETIKQEYMQERMRNLKMEDLLRRMETYTLQAQMNPHFLFNTLNTGMQLAIVEGAEKTAEFMEYLSLLFRHNIRNKDIIVPLRYEIEGISYYFYILKLRFPKNLKLVLDCPEEIQDICKVPVSILQPLVENCIVHAFKNSDIQGIVEVRAELNGKYLYLTVQDNGSGMTEEKIRQLLHPVPIEETTYRVMGLENVIQRLIFFYPENPDVITIESSLGMGTKIQICIDMEKEPCIAC